LQNVSYTSKLSFNKERQKFHKHSYAAYMQNNHIMRIKKFQTNFNKQKQSQTLTINQAMYGK